MIINKEKSNYMKAIAILMVIGEHLINRYFKTGEFLCNIMGTGGVAIFLILSGYGITVSYNQKGITKYYWLNKINKIFIPYCGITIVYIISKNIWDMEIILKNMLFIDYDRNIDGTMWYLSFAVLWYLIFWCIFILDINISIKIICLCVVSVFFFKNPFLYWGTCAWQFKNNAFSFVIGVILATLENSKKGSRFISIIKNKIIKIFIAILSLLILILFTQKQIDIFQISGIAVFVLLLLMVPYIKITFKKLEVIGLCSYYLYLIEGKWFEVVDVVSNQINIENRYIQVLVYICSLGVVISIIKLYKNKIKKIGKG